MAKKYIGYFSSNRTCSQYRVEIGSGSTTENITMGGDPFIVSYHKNNLVYDELFPSTSSLEVIVEDSCTGGTIPFADVLPNCPLDTPVVLYSGDSLNVIWRGYLNSNILSQPYDSNKYLLSLEASDALSVLQYLDYQTIEATPKVANFLEITKNIANRVGVNVIYFPRTRSIGGTVKGLTAFTMSERNFFSSDVDEPWKCDEVLREMTKYLGLTLIHWADAFYFLDRRYIGRNSTQTYIRYSGNSVTNSVTVQGLQEIDQDDYRGGNSQISLQPIYNHVKVVDSFYDVTDVLPEWFNNDNLTNRYGEMYDYEPLSVYQDARYQSYKGGAFHQKEDAVNTDAYYRKLYDNKYYDSHYYTTGLTEVSLPGTTASTSFTSTVGGTLISLSTMKNGGVYGEDGSLPSTLSWENYLMISQLNRPSNQDFNAVFQSWKAHSAQTEEFLISDFTSAWTETEVLTLKDGWRNPFVHGDNTFLVLNVSAIWERYFKYYMVPQRIAPDGFGYIFSDWQNDAVTGTTLGGSFLTFPPYLIFKLSIGGKWWNGSAFTANETAFLLPMPAEKNDEGERNGADWNEDKTTPNKVRWSYNQKSSGYMIDISRTDLDLNEEIKFSVCLPMKLSGWMDRDGNFTSAGDTVLEGLCGLNGYCYLSDFSLVASCEGMGNAQDYGDLLNENEVELNSCSVNDLSDIQFRFTTVPSEQRISYSNVGLSGGGYLTVLTEASIGVSQKPEFNCIQRYCEQYSTQTTQLSLSIKDSFVPIRRFRDMWSGKYLVCVGAEYNLGDGTLVADLEEIKQ